MALLLTREQILGAEDLTYEDVEVPEWGGTVRVKALSGAERDRFEESILVGKGKNRRVSYNNMRAKLLALCIVDEDGKQVFSTHDVEALGNKSAGALERVVNVAQRLSGLSAADMEDLEKNSVSAQSDDSTFD